MKRTMLASTALIAAFWIAPGPAWAVKGVDSGREEVNTKANDGAKAFNEGVVAFNANDFDTAIASFTKSIGIKETKENVRAQAHFVRGLSYQRKNDCTKAIADYDEAEKTIKDNPNLYASRAICYIDSIKDPVKGLADIEKAIALAPDKIDYVRVRCVLNFNAKNYEAALPDCEKVAAASPKDTSVLLAVAQAHEVLKNNDKAIAAYKQILAIDPAEKTAQDGLKRLGAAK